MYRKTGIVAKHIQRIMLAFAISLIPTAWVSVNADTSKTTASKVKYSYSYFRDDLAKYCRFLPSPTPESLYYQGRMIAFANIDDTPEKEVIVLLVVGAEPRQTFGNDADFGNWSQAFLLITDNKGKNPERKELFKLYDTGTHPLDVSAKSIELHSPSFDLKQTTDVSFKLADLTDDGTLDVWVESPYGVALISFHNGEFVEVSSNSVTRERLAETPEIESHSYDWYDLPEPQAEMYHRFLATPPPETLVYTTRQKAIANIDDTPEKETIVLMVAQPRGKDAEGGDWGVWNQAFLLIAENEIYGFPKKKDLFKLFASRTYSWELPAKTIKVESAPFVFREFSSGGPWGFQWVSFELIDLTGDGILDIWAEHAYGVAVISFQNGEFKAVCSAYSSIRREDPMEYIDLDNDGIYEIKIPDRISIGTDSGSHPEWMSLYKWDGRTYVLNNERFYAENDDFLINLLEAYNHVLIRYGRYEEYSFYIGLVYYYRGNVPMARGYLQWVVKHAKNDDYRQAAKAFLKEIPTH